MRCDGAPYERWRAIDRHVIEVDLDIDDHEIQVFRVPPMTYHVDMVRGG